MKLLLTLAPGLEPESHCHIIVVDWDDKRIIDEFQFTHTVYQQSHKGFSGATRRNGRLLVATEVELLEFDLAPLHVQGSHTYPFLNDVHHLIETDERIWVCNTGLDCIEELDHSWQPVATHHLVDRFAKRPAHVLDLMVHDFRKSLNRMRGHFEYYTHLTKRPPFRNVVKLCWQNAYRRNGHELRNCDFRPHALHPNHLMPVGNDVWVTLWRTGEIVSLQRGAVLASGFGRPHDGIVVDDELFVTDCRDNRILAHEVERHQSEVSIGCRKSDRVVTDNVRDGFLRGIAVADNSVFAGLTARRGSAPEFQTARIIELNRQSLEPQSQWVVPQQYGLQVFSILDVSDVYE